jgi:pyridoxal phosphate enzyme (YggS family)
MSIKKIKTRICEAANKSQRDADEISLIAVSKVQPNARVQAVLETGHKTFGENRVQEALSKWQDFQQIFGKLDLHLIGPLQTNKARQAVELFGSIHSVDRPKLATTLARLAQERGASPDIFIQVNTGEEAQKAGVLPCDVDAFVAECLGLDLPVKGLMCIPPVKEEASLHFALLAKMAERNGLAGLSMGMSDDFEKAIQFGATHIRVGSAIFGERVPAAG